MAAQAPLVVSDDGQVEADPRSNSFSKQSDQASWIYSSHASSVPDIVHDHLADLWMIL